MLHPVIVQIVFLLRYEKIMFWLVSDLKTCDTDRVPTSSGNHGKPRKSPKMLHAWME